MFRIQILKNGLGFMDLDWVQDPLPSLGTAAVASRKAGQNKAVGWRKESEKK